MAANGVGPQSRQPGSGVVEVECDSTTSTHAHTDTPTTHTQPASLTHAQMAAPAAQSSPVHLRDKDLRLDLHDRLRSRYFLTMADPRLPRVGGGGVGGGALTPKVGMPTLFE